MEREKEQAKGWSANITSQQYANHFEFFQFRIPLAAAEEQETENWNRFHGGVMKRRVHKLLREVISVLSKLDDFHLW